VRLFRAESGKLVASLAYWAKDIDLAEEATQDAFEQAMMQWPLKGVPESTAAWLHTVAKRKIIDKFRQHKSRSQTNMLFELEQHLLGNDSEECESAGVIPDERLRLIFTCCHPALNSEAQIALTLKTLCGLTAREIARAFLTSESTMLQRLTRAKRKIKQSGIAYEMPIAEDLNLRLNEVLSVIYLIFNESFNAYEGQTLSRQDLADESIRLVNILRHLTPTPEVIGLYCLLRLSDARTPARSSEEQAYIPLAKQNRALWKHDQIEDARRLLLETLAKGCSGPYQIHAAISALHATADSWERTDWQQITLLYDSLLKINPSSITRLNQLIAVAEHKSYREAYPALLQLEADLVNYQPYYATKAEFEHQMQCYADAVSSYQRAIKMTQNNSERDFLLKQLSRATRSHTNLR
jgi:RNA polymerase sigma-70 factor (ECF subfamily)